MKNKGGFFKAIRIVILGFLFIRELVTYKMKKKRKEKE